MRALVVLLLLLPHVLARDETHEIMVLPAEPAASAGPQDSAPATEEIEVLDTAPPFVATDEWQEVLPGQAVPPGLHVSIDMQTGKKMAKVKLGGGGGGGGRKRKE